MHKKIELTLGADIASAIKQLNPYKESGELAYIEFNGHKIYSDVDDIDSAYVKITGRTKAQFDHERKIEHEEYLAHKKAHQDDIPRLTEEWIEKGKKVLDEEYHEKWYKCVPVRLTDLYEGMELGCTLDIVSQLNTGCTLEVAKNIIDDQGHSGMSYNLVRAMVSTFCKRGGEFAEFTKH
jgi:hypothetical protein